MTGVQSAKVTSLKTAFQVRVSFLGSSQQKLRISCCFSTTDFVVINKSVILWFELCPSCSWCKGRYDYNPKRHDRGTVCQSNQPQDSRIEIDSMLDPTWNFMQKNAYEECGKSFQQKHCLKLHVACWGHVWLFRWNNLPCWGHVEAIYDYLYVDNVNN